MSNNSDIHKELMEKLDDLTSRLNKIENDIHHKESPVSADFAEQATESENLEVLAALEDETNENSQKLLYQARLYAKAALRRVYST